MLDLEERLVTATAPAKHWRNWYRAHRRVGVSPRAGVWQPGLNPGPDVFPSKEIAEQHAFDFIAAGGPEERNWFDYVGAYPEGATPDGSPFPPQPDL
jgi:hypothetical protein